jgi:hypothetical protein
MLQACQKCWNVNACSGLSRAQNVKNAMVGSDITRTRCQLTLRCLRFYGESRCVQLVRLRARGALGDPLFMKTDILVVVGHMGSVSTELPTAGLEGTGVPAYWHLSFSRYSTGQFEGCRHVKSVCLELFCFQLFWRVVGCFWYILLTQAVTVLGTLKIKFLLLIFIINICKEISPLVRCAVN